MRQSSWQLEIVIPQHACSSLFQLIIAKQWNISTFLPFSCSSVTLYQFSATSGSKLFSAANSSKNNFLFSGIRQYRSVNELFAALNSHYLLGNCAKSSTFNPISGNRYIKARIYPPKWSIAGFIPWKKLEYTIWTHFTNLNGGKCFCIKRIPRAWQERIQLLAARKLLQICSQIFSAAFSPIAIRLGGYFYSNSVRRIYNWSAIVWMLLRYRLESFSWACQGRSLAKQ